MGFAAFSACLEAAQIGSIFPGPYVLPLFRCRTVSTCTNKPPILPYRGVARTGVCDAMETTLDALARQLGLSGGGDPAGQPGAGRGDAVPQPGRQRQGLETTLAQVANEILGVHPDRVRVVHGDTALTPYSTGTWGSRSMVMAGGAVAEACRLLGERVAAIGAALLQVEAAETTVKGGALVRRDTGASVTIAEVVYTWYHKPQNLPAGVHTGGLEVTAGYRPNPDTSTHSYSCHAVVARVDTGTGAVVLEGYVIVEDGGVLVNPVIVDGQVIGGQAQGIGTALYEEMPFDEQGQPLAATLADYLLPGAGEVPNVRLEHMEAPSPWTTFGQKGIGESGAIGPPAAIVNAINDALHPMGAEVFDLPASPSRVLAAIEASRGRCLPPGGDLVAHHLDAAVPA